MLRYRGYRKTYTKRPEINTLFGRLRKEGFIAKQNFQCCQSCGYAAMEDLIQERVAKGKEVKGVIFYHNQDNTGMKSDGKLMLAYSESEVVGSIDTVAVGQRIVDLCKELGLDVKWDGSSHTRIEIQNAGV